MRVTCVRHGETERNRQGVFSGAGTEGISEPQRQALLGLGFDASPYDAFFCSPAVRCRETAEALGIRDTVIDPRLAEREFGVFEGLTVDECRIRHPSSFEAFRRLDGEFVIPGGESRDQHLERVLAWLEDAVRHQNVLAITHGGTIDFLYRLGAGEPMHGGPTVFAGPNAAWSTFEVDGPRVSVIEHGVQLL